MMYLFRLQYQLANPLLDVFVQPRAPINPGRYPARDRPGQERDSAVEAVDKRRPPGRLREELRDWERLHGLDADAGFLSDRAAVCLHKRRPSARERVCRGSHVAGGRRHARLHREVQPLEVQGAQAGRGFVPSRRDLLRAGRLVRHFRRVS